MTTLNDIEALPKEFLLASDVADYLGTNPDFIRGQAHEDPTKLGFPVVVIGTRVKIPKEPFIKFMRGEIPVVYLKALVGET